MTSVNTAASGNAVASGQNHPADDDNVTLQDSTTPLQPNCGPGLADRMDRKLDFANQSIRNAQARVTAARQQVREVTEASADYIRQNPWHAISISAGIGLLAGMLFRRR